MRAEPVGGAYHAALVVVVVVVYINRQQGLDESPFGEKSCVAAEKCERPPVYSVAQSRLRGAQWPTRSSVIWVCSRAAAHCYALKMKWHLECAFHLTPETLMSCSCALQSRLAQGMLMMLRTWEGDSFGRFPCVRVCMCMCVWEREREREEEECLSCMFFCKMMQSWVLIGFHSLHASVSGRGNPSCEHPFEVDMGAHIGKSLHSSQRIVIGVRPGCPTFRKKVHCK